MNSSHSGETESKWTCEYCTYENWPSSLKCTMCRGAKPLLGEDIYRLREPSPQRCTSNVASGPVLPVSEPYNLGIYLIYKTLFYTFFNFFITISTLNSIFLLHWF